MNIRCEDIAAACIFESLIMNKVLSLVSVLLVVWGFSLLV